MFYRDATAVRTATTFELKIALEDIGETLSLILPDGEPTSFRSEQFAKQLEAERQVITSELARRPTGYTREGNLYRFVR